MAGSDGTAGTSGKGRIGLKGGIGILLLLAICGLAVGLTQGWWREQTYSTGLLSESERPKRLEAMRAAIDAFYAKPSEETHKVAREAMIDYRRTFADALPGTFQAASEKLDCGQTEECRLLRERQSNDQIASLGPIAMKMGSLSSASPEYHKKWALETTLNRRLNIVVGAAYIDNDWELFKNEKELSAARARFFAEIDKEVAKIGRGEQGDEGFLLKYLDTYVKATEKTFRPVRRGGTCQRNQETTDGDLRLCNGAVDLVNAVRLSPDVAAKVAAAKKAISDRDAPLDVLKRSISQIFRKA